MSFFRIPSRLCRLLMVSIMLLAMLVCSVPISHVHGLNAGTDHHHLHDDVIGLDAHEADDLANQTSYRHISIMV